MKGLWLWARSRWCSNLVTIQIRPQLQKPNSFFNKLIERLQISMFLQYKINIGLSHVALAALGLRSPDSPGIPAGFPQVFPQDFPWVSQGFPLEAEGQLLVGLGGGAPQYSGGLGVRSPPGCRCPVGPCWAYWVELSLS